MFTNCSFGQNFLRTNVRERHCWILAAGNMPANCAYFSWKNVPSLQTTIKSSVQFYGVKAVSITLSLKVETASAFANICMGSIQMYISNVRSKCNALLLVKRFV